MASSLVIGKGGSGSTSLNRAGKRLVRDGLPVSLASAPVGNERGRGSFIGELSVDSETNPSDMTILMWQASDSCKVWDVTSRARGPSDTVDEDTDVLADGNWSGDTS